jgi:signal peptidase II
MTRLHTLGLAFAAIVYALDQFIKWLMIGPLALRDTRVIDIIPNFALLWTENRGVSLGLFTATAPWQRWALVAMTAAIAITVLVWLLREKKLADILPLSLVLGGALGNITDRIRFGYVVDYADLHFGEWRPFMIFNLADAAITIGVLLILARSFLSREKPVKNGESAPESQTHA